MYSELEDLINELRSYAYRTPSELVQNQLEMALEILDQLLEDLQ